MKVVTRRDRPDQTATDRLQVPDTTRLYFLRLHHDAVIS
jgi:hypothetical protein